MEAIDGFSLLRGPSAACPAGQRPGSTALCGTCVYFPVDRGRTRHVHRRRAEPTVSARAPWGRRLHVKRGGRRVRDSRACSARPASRGASRVAGWTTSARPRPAPIPGTRCRWGFGWPRRRGQRARAHRAVRNRQRGAQFEQGGALAAGEFEGGADVGSASVGVGVGVGAKPQQFGVVEAHPGVVGQRKCGVQAWRAALGWPAAINSRPRTAS